MNRLSTLSFRVPLCLAVLIAFAPPPAHAGCSTGVNVSPADGGAYFGLRSDGARLGAGQSFTMDCDAQFLAATFGISLTQGGMLGTVPYMVMGDPGICEILDDAFQVVASTTTLLPHNDGPAAILCDFSGQSVFLAPGTYIVGLRTDVDRAASIAFSTTDTSPGVKYTYFNGDWNNVANGNETGVVAIWDPDASPVEVAGWGRTKALYR